MVSQASDSGSSASEQEDTLDGEDPMAAFLRAEKKKSRVKGSKEKKRKRDEESKEERRARKEAKREKKAKKERLRIKVEPGRGRNGHERVKVERDDRDGGERDLRERGEDRVGRADRDDWREGKWEMEREEKRGKAGNGDGRDKEKDGRERERSRSRENGRFQMDGGDRYDDRDSVIRRRRDEDRYDRRRQD